MHDPSNPHQNAMFLLIQDTIDRVKAAGGDVVPVMKAAHLCIYGGDRLCSPRPPPRML